MSDMHMLFTHP